MKQRIHLKKRRRPWTKGKKMIVIFLSICVATGGFLVYLGNQFTPVLLATAELEVNKFSTILINKAISQVLEDKINTEELFTSVKTENGEIQTVDFNPIVVNQILNVATTVVQNNIRFLEEGDLDAIGIYDMNLPEDRLDALEKGIIQKIPIGIVTGNSILANLGPQIPIRLQYIGDVNSNINTKITQYGINNALMEISVHLEMSAKILLPFQSKKMVVNCDIPIAMKMIQGKVPNYYSNGIHSNSSEFSIPLQDTSQ